MLYVVSQLLLAAAVLCTPQQDDLLNFIYTQTLQKDNCSITTIVPRADFNRTLFNLTLDERFAEQSRQAVSTANFLTGLLRHFNYSFTAGKKISFLKDIYKQQLLTNVLSDELVLGAGIAAQTSHESKNLQFDYFPYVRRSNGKVDILNMKTDQLNCPKIQGWYLDWMCDEMRKDDHFVRLRARKGCSPLEGSLNFSQVIPVFSGTWYGPYRDKRAEKLCSWKVSYVVPIYTCIKPNMEHLLSLNGLLYVDVDLKHLDIDQCSPKGPFGSSHRCKGNSVCNHQAGRGFTVGSYSCKCGNTTYEGSKIEASYSDYLRKKSADYDKLFLCERQVNCCQHNYNSLSRGIPLCIQGICILIVFVLAVYVIRWRKKKVMKSSMWLILLMVLFGCVLLYSSVILLFFQPSVPTCLLIPWLREIGFSIVYGALILKIYKVLAEFQSRNAHRVHIRDRDMLKYLAVVVLVVVGYLSAWTAVSVDNVAQHGVNSSIDLVNNTIGSYTMCKAHWWDYVIEFAEFFFLCFGIYLCYCSRSAYSDYSESKYVSYAIYNETFFSVMLHISRHFIWENVHPDYVFILYFLHCQLTVTATLVYVFAPKFWYINWPPDEEHFRQRAYSSSEVGGDTVLPSEAMRLNVGVSSNGDVDIGDITIGDMDPEDIRAELKRLYTQLQVLRTKIMRKGNPHISKRRGGRKQTHRRFSLQAFHYKHKHAAHSHADTHEHEMSKTPEESTNSAEGVSMAIDKEDMPSATVTFRSNQRSSAC